MVYLDPPYLITFSEYNKLWNENSERRLLALLDNLSRRMIRFAISNVSHYKGKVNATFLEWSRQYNVHSIKSNYISYHDNTIKNFNEVLVTNFRTSSIYGRTQIQTAIVYHDYAKSSTVEADVVYP